MYVLLRCPYFRACKNGTWGGKMSCLERCPQFKGVLIDLECSGLLGVIKGRISETLRPDG